MFTNFDALRFGWTRFRFFGGPLLMMGSAAVMLMVISQGLVRHGGRPGLAMAVGSIAAWALVMLVLLRSALRHFDGLEVALLEPAPLAVGFGRWLRSGLAYALLVGAGLVLLVVPGVVAAAAFAFAPMLSAEGTRAPLRTSARLTVGHRGQLLGLAGLLLGLNALGLLALGLGLAVTVPMSALAVAYAYRRLQGRVEAPLPAG